MRSSSPSLPLIFSLAACAALCTVAAAPAVAEPLVQTRIGLALSTTQHRGDDSLVGPGAVLEVTTPISPTASFGVRVAMAHGSQHDEDRRAMSVRNIDEDFYAVWAGGVVQKRVNERAFISPWLGVSTGHEDRCNYYTSFSRPSTSTSDCSEPTWSEVGLAAGLSFAVDLVDRSPNHWQGFVDASIGIGVESMSFLFGIAYRYSCD